ncbi:MAG: hypothetical protein WC130_06765 [Kiritimatiellia bacterium]
MTPQLSVIHAGLFWSTSPPNRFNMSFDVWPLMPAGIILALTPTLSSPPITRQQ